MLNGCDHDMKQQYIETFIRIQVFGYTTSLTASSVLHGIPKTQMVLGVNACGEKKQCFMEPELVTFHTIGLHMATIPEMMYRSTQATY